MNLITETFLGAKTLVTGMRLTIAQFFKPTVTVHYPHATLPIPAAFRGHIELKWNEETGRPNCTACGICAKACPSACIVLDGVKPEGEKKKVVTDYHLDYTLCSLCSLCIEACPFDAIQHSPRYNLASIPNIYSDMDLVERYKEQVTRANKTWFIPDKEAAARFAAEEAAAAKVAAEAKAKAAAAAKAAAPAAAAAPAPAATNPAESVATPISAAPAVPSVAAPAAKEG